MNEANHFTTPEGEQFRRKLHVDVTVPKNARDGFDILRHGWENQVGDAIPLPPSKPVGGGSYRVSIHHAKVHDAVVEDLYSEPIIGGTGGEFAHLNDRVVVHLVERGAWHFARRGSQDSVAVRGGQFVVRLNDLSWKFGIGPRTTAKVLILPTGDFRPLLGSRQIVGALHTPETRLLMAHIGMIDTVLAELSPAGIRAARDALIELVRGVIEHGVDGAEPALASALVQAARRLAENRLTDRELSPQVVARELNVSVRTLQRAFAVDEESVTAFIRRRRLEQARHDLATTDKMTVSELAARWHYADTSHFIRTFRRHYGETPAQFARRVRGTGGLFPPASRRAPGARDVGFRPLETRGIEPAGPTGGRPPHHP
ncbi:helix-turn-helix domain-containing protein [Pseudonocardia xinjiangensis]|uniref:helix-turn-helix domain-containing protein n=1 Tax=Pseudonocardia xinjiangensis TaxID=75289 RepID=UPI003D926785